MEAGDGLGKSEGDGMGIIDQLLGGQKIKGGMFIWRQSEKELVMSKMRP